jgi:serine/threonine-protein kinase
LLIAIRRYRLWDIDFIINRSLIYGALTVVLLAAFAASAFVLQTLFGWLTGGAQSPVVLGLSMLAVGVAFQPTRQWLKRFVDQRLYGIEIDYERAARKYRAEKVFEGPRLTSLGEYGKLELIGRGGMAEVYRAHHPTLKRPVAIKILSRELAAQSPEYYKRFEREARALTILQHPNIIHLHEFAATGEGVLYMVMDYVPGSDLSDYIKRYGRLELRQALPVLQDVAAALDFAHAHGLIHRDVKPSNILLTPVTTPGAGRTHRAVLTDFGIAKLQQATQLTNTSIVGTFDYIAPEQIKDATEVDGRADIYALGVVAFHALTGRCPFAGAHPAALLIAHLQQPPPDPRDIAPGLRQRTARAIQRAMAKEPIERFRTAGELVAALGAGVSDNI